MFKKGSYVTIIFVISTFLQLISQIIVTRTFGAKLELDTFLAAVALPTIMVTVIYGTLNDAFLPILGEEKNKNPENADTFLFTNIVALGVLSLLATVIMTFFSPLISSFFYHSRGDEFVRSISIQMSYMFYSFPLSVIATLLGTYFYMQKKYFRFPFAQLMGTVANLAIILLLSPTMGVWSLITGFVANIVFQIAFVIPNISISFKLSQLKLLQLLWIWIPLIIGNFAIRSDAVLIRSFGAHLPEGYLVYLNLISKIFSIGTSVMTIGIQVILLPHLVEYFSQKKYEEAIKNVTRAKLITVCISVLVTLAIALFSPLLIHILFVGKKFTAHDADICVSLIPYFIVPAIGWGASNVFFQPLFALKKTFSVGAVNIVSLILAWTIGQVVTDHFGAIIGITTALIILLFSSIIGTEILWQYHQKKLLSTEQVL